MVSRPGVNTVLRAFGIEEQYNVNHAEKFSLSTTKQGIQAEDVNI